MADGIGPIGNLLGKVSSANALVVTLDGGSAVATSMTVDTLTFTIAAPDVILTREGAGHLIQRNSTTAQRFSVANTWASAISNELFSVDWQTQANFAIVGTRTAATGATRGILFVSQAANASNSHAMLFLASGNSSPIRLGAFTNAVAIVNSNTYTTVVSLGESSNTATSGTFVNTAILPTYNQASGTAANTDLLINRTQTAVGSGRQMLVDAQVSTVSIAGLSRAGLTLYANTTATQGEVASSEKKAKTVASIANAAATDIFTVTIPNAQNMATIRVTLSASLGAGGAIGAGEATANISYDFAVTRTAGVATVATASAAYGSSASAVAGADTITVTAAASAMTGLVSASQTFTIQATVSRGGGSSSNHTCRATAEIINALASGITIA